MTGGLNSVVAAFLLKSQGLNVTAVSLQFFKDGDPIKSRQSCHVENLEEVQSICDQLEIPLYAVDVKAEFQSKVLDQVMAARLSGHFFSTCMECHKIKFRILNEKAKKLQCQHIATGHFAKIHRDATGEMIEIYTANDQANDQSHLLGRVEQKYLQNLILPLSNLRKKEVQSIANRYQLQYLRRYKKDENCFFKGDQILPYISQQAHDSLYKLANFFDHKQQLYLGHATRGLHHFYLGQKGIKTLDKQQIIDKNLVVTKLCLESQQVVLGPQTELSKRQIKVGRLNFKKNFDRSKPCRLYVKFEEGRPSLAIVFFKNNNTALIEFAQNVYNKGKGHVAIFYNDLSKKAKIVGSGIVEQFAHFAPIIRGHTFHAEEQLAPDANIEDIIDEHQFRF